MLRREREGNRKLTWVVVGLLLITIALAISLLVFLTRNEVTPQTAHDTALISAQQNLEANPKEASAYERLARAQLAGDEADKALQTLRDGLAATEDNLLYVAMGDVYRARKEWPQAISSYDMAEKARKEVLGIAEVKDPQQDGTEATRDEILAQIYYGRGLAQIADGSEGKGRLDLETAAAYQPTSAMIWSALGDTYFAEGEIDRATEAYNKALTYVPTYQPAQAGLTRIEGGE